MIKCGVCHREHNPAEDAAFNVIAKESGGYFFYCAEGCSVTMTADEWTKTSEGIVRAYKDMLERKRSKRTYFSTEAIDELLIDMEIEEAKKKARRKKK